jgi:uncharacterized protein
MDKLPPNIQTFGDVLNERLGRRTLLRGMLAAGVMAITAPTPSQAQAAKDAAKTALQTKGAERYVFDEIAHGVDERHHVASGYDADVLIRWGDPLVKGAAEFRPGAQTPEEQEGQFGYNNDYLGFVPLNASGDRALLCVNHEYTIAPLMFPGVMDAAGKIDRSAITPDRVGVEMAATGNSIVEITRASTGKWSVVAGSTFNRTQTDANQGRSNGYPRDWHVQQLRWRRHPLGHLPHCRRKF